MNLVTGVLSASFFLSKMFSMSMLQLIVLAVVQGIAEFLPISSSAHLQLVPFFMQVPDQGLVMDLGLHLGTLLAVCLYFWRDVLALAGGGIDILRRKKTDRSRLTLHLVIATIPAVLCGLIMHILLPDGIRNVQVIAWTSIIFGAILWLADWRGKHVNRIDSMRWLDGLIIGLAQILSLIPGVSRSGSTMSMALFLGYERREAARFSSLMSIPVTLAAVSLGVLDLLKSHNETMDMDFVIGASMSFVTALLALTFMMRWLKRFGFAVFGIYRIVLGIVLMVLLYGS